jgi:DUF4097 and DUF4098 domain-containing protein YvlB
MTRKLWNLSLLIAAALVLSVTGAGADDLVTAYFDETYPMNATGSVSLENINGDVTVEVWDRAEVRVHAEKKASSQKLLDGLEIKVEASSNSVRIDTDYPNTSGFGGKRSMKVEYTLTIPRQAAVDEIDLVNGDLLIEGVQGGIRAESVNGKIIARQVSGSLRISTVNGSIEPDMESLTDVERIDLESVNGKITLALPASVGAFVRAETVNGKISNDFGIPVHKGKYVGSDMKGEIGDGGIQISLDTVNGAISVTSR